MRQQINETTIHNRYLNDEEKSKMRKTHWVLIPALLIPAFIIWVVSLVDTVPNAAKYAVYTIGTGAILIMFWKQYQLEQELKNGEAEVVRGILEDKYKFGGGKKFNSRSGAAGPSKSQASFILVFDGKKYWVQPKIYKQAEKGALSEMVWMPRSKYVVSIQKV